MHHIVSGRNPESILQRHNKHKHEAIVLQILTGILALWKMCTSQNLCQVKGKVVAQSTDMI